MPGSRVTTRRKPKYPKKSKAGKASAKRRKGIKEEADLTGMDENSFDDELDSDMEPSFCAIDLTTTATQPRIAEDQAATATPATVARRVALSGEDLFLTVTAKPPGKAVG